MAPPCTHFRRSEACGARDPSRHRRRSSSTTVPSGIACSRSCPTAGRSAYRADRSSRAHAFRGTTIAAWRSKPSTCACHALAPAGSGRSIRSPQRRAGIPARGPSAATPCTEAAASHASKGVSSAHASGTSSPAGPRRQTAPRQQPVDAPRDGTEQHRQTARCPAHVAPERNAPTRVRREHAVRHERVVWTLRFSALPKRWTMATAPKRPSAMRRRARARNHPPTVRRWTPTTARQSAWSHATR